MAINDAAIRNLKPTSKKLKRFGGGWLHLFLSPTGGKLRLIV
jgi:hypothetical protein